MVLNVIDIDTNTHFILIHRRLLIAYLAVQPHEVSIFDGGPQVKKGASISSIRPLTPCRNDFLSGESVTIAPQIRSAYER